MFYAKKVVNLKIVFFVFLIVNLFLIQEAFAQYEGTDLIIHEVGKELDPKGKGFDVKYTLEGKLEPNVIINPEKKTITFHYDSQEIEEDVLIITIPNELMTFPREVTIDGRKIPEAILDLQKNETIVYLPLYKDSKEITIRGTTVIPEFGPVTTLILLISITLTIIISSKKRSFSLFRS